MTGLLFGHDAEVFTLVCEHFKMHNHPRPDACIGLLNKQGFVSGGVFLHGYNGSDIQLSYYGYRTVTPGVARTVAQFIMEQFDPARVTVIVSKKNKRLIRSCQRFGCRLEGIQRCYYGKDDCNRNTGVRLVMFRQQVQRLANSVSKKVA